MSLSLMDFAGSWHIDRVIEDRLSGEGRFEGTAHFTPEGRGLRYAETGTLTLPTGAILHAERVYHWVQDRADIAVSFEDGRPFHRFDPEKSGAGDRHHCDPDIYDVVYVFEDWPNWSSQWTVNGPRKDYVMRTHYSVYQGRDR